MSQVHFVCTTHVVNKATGSCRYPSGQFCLWKYCIAVLLLAMSVYFSLDSAKRTNIHSHCGNIHDARCYNIYMYKIKKSKIKSEKEN